MLGFEEARALLLRAIERLPAERVALERAHGRVLSEPVIATSPIPPFAYSAMDGYALATSDLHGPGPFEL